MKLKSNIKLFKYIKIISTLFQKLIYKAVKYEEFLLFFFKLGHSYSHVTLFQYSNPNSLGTLTVFRAPLTLRQRDNTQNTYRFPDQKRTFVLFSCDYRYSFTPSPTALSSFLTSKCVLQLHGRYFLSDPLYPASSNSWSPRPPFPQGTCWVELLSTWSHSTLSHNAGHAVLDLRYLSLRQLFFYIKNFFSFQNKASDEANTAYGGNLNMENNWTKSHIVKRLGGFFFFHSKVILYGLDIILEDTDSGKYNNFLCHTIILMFFMFSKFSYFL